MHNSVIKYLWDVFAPPTLHLKLKQIQWIANIWDNVWSQDSFVMRDMCERNLDWNLRKSWLHMWKWLNFTSHIHISTVGSWYMSSLLLLLCLLFKCCCFHFIFIRDNCAHYFLLLLLVPLWLGLPCLSVLDSVPGFSSCFLYVGHVRACLVMIFSPFFFVLLWISHLWLPSSILLPFIFCFGHLLIAVGCSGHSTNCSSVTLLLCGY